MLSKLNLYLARIFLSNFFIVFLIFAALLIIGDFVEQFRKSTGKEVPIKIIFQLAVLNFFGLIEFIIPIVAFFASLISFVILIRNSEYIIIASIGISNLKILLPALMIYFLVGVFYIIVINPLSTVLFDKYTELEYKHLVKSDKFASITKNGLWLKQFNDEKELSSVLYAKQVSNSGATIYNFMILEYDNNGVFQGRLDGKKATLNYKYWDMSEVQVSPRYNQASYSENLIYDTNINPKDITDSLSSPKSISIWRLAKFIIFLENLGYSAREFKIYFYNLIFMPIFISCLVILSASIVSDLKQNDKYYKVIIISLILIFLVYFLSNLFDALGSTGQVSPIFSKLITPIIVIVLSVFFFKLPAFKGVRT